ncbi:MAG: toll/interleukin-1 receptor domain-containing protein [Anaerolineae bacterium]|nr:toll/interleukin-1 receptor domain-containing protein [Anaerolineae bacterium]
MKHIFISYSPKDSRHMANMQDQLLRIGYKPWIDPNPRPGQDWRFDIDDAIRASDALIVIVTPASVDSTFVTYEWALALGFGIAVIPVKFAPGKMHPRLNTLEQFDVNSFTTRGHFWDYFGRELPRLLGLPLFHKHKSSALTQPIQRPLKKQNPIIHHKLLIRELSCQRNPVFILWYDGDRNSIKCTN